MVVDDFGHEFLTIEVDFSLLDVRKTGVLDTIAAVRVYPQLLVLDNVPKTRASPCCAGRSIIASAYISSLQTSRSRTRFIGSFNGKFQTNASTRTKSANLGLARARLASCAGPQARRLPEKKGGTHVGSTLQVLEFPPRTRARHEEKSSLNSARCSATSTGGLS